MARHHVTERDLVAASQNDRSLDRVFQLADVPRPIVGQDPVPRLVLELEDLLSVLRREPLQKLVGQQLNVLGAATKGGQVDLHDGQSIVEIFAQLAVGELREDLYY